MEMSSPGDGGRGDEKLVYIRIGRRIPTRAHHESQRIHLHQERHQI